MAKIHNLSISNFRGIKSFNQKFDSEFICLIGRGDSGKSTILEAIALALSSSWNISFFDNDFYNCNTSESIVIETTLIDIPENLLQENKFGLFQRFIDPINNELLDEISDKAVPALTVHLEIKQDLEPQWSIISNIGECKPISANDRAKFSTFLLSDHSDRHFSWSKGSPLHALLKQANLDDEFEDPLLNISRKMKTHIDEQSLDERFSKIIQNIKSKAETFGIDISTTQNSIDFKDLLIKEGKISLHEENIPFRLKGKGTKRLISMSIQSLIANQGGIILIDEIEQGLEPDRVQNLVKTLKQNNHGQVFITTHSRDVIVGLEAENLFLKRKGNESLLSFDIAVQGLLRSNPESFFANKIIICEGATEIGICMSINKHRIKNGNINIASKGVRFADGNGENFKKYAQEFLKSEYPLCIFCDSDKENASTNQKKKKLATGEKEALLALGATIIDWNKGDNLESGIIKDIPFSILEKLFNLAAEIKVEDNLHKDIDQCKSELLQSIKEKLSDKSALNFSGLEDTAELRNIIAQNASSKSWFKSQTKGFRLGNIILENLDNIDNNSRLKTNLISLSEWIDKA